MNVTNDIIRACSFDKAYNALLAKVLRKGYEEKDLKEIISWLMGCAASTKWLTI